MAHTNGSRPPPFNQDAERSVLGAILLMEDAWDSVGASLDADDFFTPQHRVIWRAMEAAVRNYGRADATTTLEMLRSDGSLNGDVKGDYLLDLAGGVPDPGRASSYAKIVRELSLRRRLLDKSRNVGAAATEGDDYRGAVEDLVREIYRADTPGLQVARTAVEILATPPTQVDAFTDPPLLVRKGTTVLASATKVGKTNMWLHAAWALTDGKPLFGMQVHQPTSVLLVELELSEATVYKRLKVLEEALGWSKEGQSRFNVICNRSLQIDKRGGQGRLTQIINTTVPRPEFVILDSYNAAISGDPDSTAESRRGLHVLHEIQEQTGVAFGITCEIRKAPPGQKLRYSIDDLKGNNVVAYDADAVVMMIPTDDSRKTLKLAFPGLRHCEDLPDNLLLHRKGLTFELEKGKDEDPASDAAYMALKEYAEAGGEITWRGCQGELKRLGIKCGGDRLNKLVSRLKGASS